MKDNFLLKKSYIDTFSMLDNENAGKLIKGIFNYVNTGNSDLENLLEVIFLPIKQFIDSNEEKYQKRCNANAKNGLLGGRPKDDFIDEEIKPNETQNNPMGYFDKNTHISYINNHLENKKIIGCGEEEEKKPLKAEDAGLLEETDKKKLLSQIKLKILKELREKTISNKLYGPTTEDTGLLEEIVAKINTEMVGIEIDKGTLNSLTKQIIQEIVIDKILLYLNEVTGSSYRLDTANHRTKVLNQLKNGHKLNDFYKVIDNKSKKWLKTDMQEYLRPSTLFGTKMDEYLEQPVSLQKQSNISATATGEKEPSWFKKEIKKDEASQEEQEQMKKLLRSI